MNKEKKPFGRVAAFAILLLVMTGTLTLWGVRQNATPKENPPTPTANLTPHMSGVGPSVNAKPPQDEQEKPENPDPEPTPPGEANPKEEELLPEGITHTPMASEHFAMAEYACDCDGYCDGWPTPMDAQLLADIETLRNTLGAPVIITSGLRCPQRNAEVGGIENSRHLYGHAADLYCPAVSIKTVAEVAANLGLTVITYYDQGFIHVQNDR